MKNLDLLQSLKFAWTADIELLNGQVISIWYTCFPSIKNEIKNVLQISSDFPKHFIG